MTDLCFENDAEIHCQAAITASLEVSTDNIDGLQTLASLRLSQNRKSEASEIMVRVYSQIKFANDQLSHRTIFEDINGTSASVIGSTVLLYHLSIRIDILIF
jgi:hypothetical protein